MVPMLVELNLVGGGATSFEAFAIMHGLTMEVNERVMDGRLDKSWRFYAHFKNIHVVDGRFVEGTHGNGATPEAAIADYMERLRGKRIAKGARGQGEEIQCPNDWAWAP